MKKIRLKISVRSCGFLYIKCFYTHGITFPDSYNENVTGIFSNNVFSNVILEDFVLKMTLLILLDYQDEILTL